jgi:hypothetical protein
MKPKPDREEVGQTLDAQIPPVGECDEQGLVWIEFGENLQTGSAAGEGLDPIGVPSDSDCRKRLVSLGDCPDHSGALSANREPIGAVLNVRGGYHLSRGRQQRSAYLKPGVRGVSALARSFGVLVKGREVEPIAASKSMVAENLADLLACGRRWHHLAFQSTNLGGRISESVACA